MIQTIRILALTSLLALAAAPLVHAESYPLKTCIITGDTFGGDNGPPIDIHYKGRLVRLCCKSCVRKFNANPEKYLQMIDKAAAQR